MLNKILAIPALDTHLLKDSAHPQIALNKHSVSSVCLVSTCCGSGSAMGLLPDNCPPLPHTCSFRSLLFYVCDSDPIPVAGVWFWLTAETALTVNYAE